MNATNVFQDLQIIKPERFFFTFREDNVISAEPCCRHHSTLLTFVSPASACLGLFAYFDLSLALNLPATYPGEQCSVVGVTSYIVTFYSI